MDDSSDDEGTSKQINKQEPKKEVNLLDFGGDAK
jgi:hypothetical protein